MQLVLHHALIQSN